MLPLHKPNYQVFKNAGYPAWKAREIRDKSPSIADRGRRTL